MRRSKADKKIQAGNCPRPAGNRGKGTEGAGGRPAPPARKEAEGTEEEEREVEEKGKIGGRLGGVLSWLLCLLLVPVILLNFALIIRNYTDPDRIPGVFGYMPMIVLSGSMSPEFEAGCVVLIRAVEDPAALKKGDVVCYLLDGKAITHRIIDVERDGASVRYIVRGDANNVEDRLAVNPGQIQGEYTGVHIEGLGDLCMFMQSTTGMIFFVVCPLVCLLLWDFLARKIKGRKEKSRAEELEEELRALRAQAQLQGEAPAAVRSGQAPGETGTVRRPDSNRKFKEERAAPLKNRGEAVKGVPRKKQPRKAAHQNNGEADGSSGAGAPKTLLDFITPEQYRKMGRIISEDALFMLEQLIKEGRLEAAERLILSKVKTAGKPPRRGPAVAHTAEQKVRDAVQAVIEEGPGLKEEDQAAAHEAAASAELEEIRAGTAAAAQAELEQVMKDMAVSKEEQGYKETGREAVSEQAGTKAAAAEEPAAGEAQAGPGGGAGKETEAQAARGDQASSIDIAALQGLLEQARELHKSISGGEDSQPPAAERGEASVPQAEDIEGPDPERDKLQLLTQQLQQETERLERLLKEKNDRL